MCLPTSRMWKAWLCFRVDTKNTSGKHQREPEEAEKSPLLKTTYYRVKKKTLEHLLLFSTILKTHREFSYPPSTVFQK